MLWKPLLIIAPAGLVLGTIGGQMAKPVILDRAGVDSAQSMFQSRAERYGRTGAYSAQAETYYDGGYSYAPDAVDARAIAWAPPDYEHYADVPLPSLAELDARQAALLADPDVQYRSPPSDPAASVAAADAPPALQAAGETAPAAQANTQIALAPEPRTDGGALPAIW